MNRKNKFSTLLLFIASIIIAQTPPLVGNSYEATEFVNTNELEYKKITFINDTICEYYKERLIINSSGDTIKDENYPELNLTGNYSFYDNNTNVGFKHHSSEQQVIHFSKVVMFEILDGGQNLKLIENDLIFEKKN